MKIEIKSIPASEFRIRGGVGDYWYEEDGTLQIRVLETGNQDYAKLIAVHEFIEEWLTKRRGLSEPDIQAFDEKWFVEDHAAHEEPGFDPRAPYLQEHTVADAIERLLCAFCGIPLAEYEQAIEKALG